MPRVDGRSALETGPGGIAEKILRRLRKIPGSMWWRNPQNAITGLRGMPDISGVIGGHFVVIEVKRPGHLPTALQALRLKEFEDAGATAGLATSVEEALAIVAPVVEKYLPELVSAMAD